MSIINEYYDVLDKLENLVLEETETQKENSKLYEYQNFVKEKLKEYNVRKVNDLSPVQKIKFFEEINAWEQDQLSEEGSVPPKASGTKAKSVPADYDDLIAGKNLKVKKSSVVAGDKKAGVVAVPPKASGTKAIKKPADYEDFIAKKGDGRHGKKITKESDIEAVRKQISVIEKLLGENTEKKKSPKKEIDNISEMSRGISTDIIKAFMNRKDRKIGNSEVKNDSLYLFGNKIAKWKNDEMWITNAGWSTNTTKDRLNALPNVSISQRKGVWYLNGKEWDGEWIAVR